MHKQENINGFYLYKYGIVMICGKKSGIKI